MHAEKGQCACVGKAVKPFGKLTGNAEKHSAEQERKAGKQGGQKRTLLLFSAQIAHTPPGG